MVDAGQQNTRTMDIKVPVSNADVQLALAQLAQNITGRGFVPPKPLTPFIKEACVRDYYNLAFSTPIIWHSRSDWASTIVLPQPLWKNKV